MRARECACQFAFKDGCIRVTLQVYVRIYMVFECACVEVDFACASLLVCTYFYVSSRWCACVRACEHAHARARARECMYTCVCVCGCICMCVCVICVCLRESLRMFYMCVYM